MGLVYKRAPGDPPFLIQNECDSSLFKPQSILTKDHFMETAKNCFYFSVQRAPLKSCCRYNLCSHVECGHGLYSTVISRCGMTNVIIHLRSGVAAEGCTLFTSQGLVYLRVHLLAEL